MEARFNRWDTRSIAIPVTHHRPTTSAYDPVSHSFKSGFESYKMGADVFLTMARTVLRLSWRPYFKISLAFLKGYFSARRRREPLIISNELAVFINGIHYKKFNIFKR